MSQKNKHTPGPWKVFNAWEYNDIIKLSRIGNNDNNTVMECESAGYEIRVSNEADLHLIAAAPEMLEALEACLAFVDILKFYHSVENWSDEPKIRAVVAKAKGES